MLWGHKEVYWYWLMGKGLQRKLDFFQPVYFGHLNQLNWSDLGKGQNLCQFFFSGKSNAANFPHNKEGTKNSVVEIVNAHAQYLHYMHITFNSPFREHLELTYFQLILNSK